MALRSVGGITRGQAAALHTTTRTGGGGRWCTTNHTGAAVAAVDTLYLYWVPEWMIPGPLTLLRTRCSAGGAGSAVKFALWRSSQTTGRPDGLPFAGQNAGLSTATTNTWQDQVVASVPVASPGGVWFGSKYTGTLPQMVANQPTGVGTAQIVYPVGSMPTAPRVNFSVVDAYANDIMALNLTGVPLVEVASSIPAFAVEWA